MVEKTIPGFEKISESRKYKYDLCSSDISHYKVRRYGESIFGGGSKELKVLISKFYCLSTKNVSVVEGGCSNANFLVFYSLIKKGDEVLVENPGYGPLFRVPEIFGAKIKRFDRKFEDNFQLDLKQILKKITNKTKMVILTNFYNPGGVRINEGDLLKLLKMAEKKKFYVLCDETYSDPLIKKDIKAVGSIGKYGISTYGLSKKYGLSTLRCGIVVANEDVINKIIKASFTSIAVNSGLLENEWLKFFKKDIYKLNKRSERILKKNYSFLRKHIISRDDIEWVEPEKGSSICVLKLNGIKDFDRFKDLLNKEDVLLAISKDGFVRLGVGGNSRMFKKGILKLGKILDSFPLSEVLDKKKSI